MPNVRDRGEGGRFMRVSNLVLAGSRKRAVSLGLVTALILASAPASAAKPGGGGTSDPCAALSLDFPAFAYWKANGKNQQIYVADATGKCIRPVAAIKSGTGGGGSIQFSYPVGGVSNRGRVAWVEAPAVVGVDFTVDTGTRQIAVFAKKTIYSGTGGYISLNKNGSALYSIRNLSSGGQVIDRQALDSVGSPMGPPMTVFEAPVGNIVQTISVNGTETYLFADYHPSPGPPTAPRQLVWIPLDATNVVNVILSHAAQKEFTPAAHPTSDLVVYQDYIPVELRIDGCDPLFIKEIGGAPVPYSPPTAYGLKPTWMNDKVLADGRRGPTRTDTGCDYTGTIMQLDPGTGVQTALTSGYDPDGK